MSWPELLTLLFIALTEFPIVYTVLYEMTYTSTSTTSLLLTQRRNTVANSTDLLWPMLLLAPVFNSINACPYS